MSTRKKPTPVSRLMEAMDRCATTRSDALSTNGYRAALDVNHIKRRESRKLFLKEQAQWTAVSAAEAKFRRLAQRLLREARR